MTIYQGVNGIAEKAEEDYVGVSDTAQRIKRVYVGVNDIARKVYEATAPNLPDAYQQVEFLKSTGTQYIDTSVVNNFNATTSHVIEMKMCWDNLTGEQVPWGVRNGSTSYVNFGIYSSGTWYLGSGNYTGGSTKATIGSIYTVRAEYISGSNGQKLIVNGDTVVTRGAASANYNMNAYLFRQNGTPRNCYMKLYSFKWWINGSLIKNYYPCYRKSDNVAGLYNLVEGSEAFETNDGTGIFEVGPNYKWPL